MSSGNSAEKKKNFIELYGDVTLKQIVCDWKEIQLKTDNQPWANFPPEKFLEFAKNYPKTPFDSIPSLECYIKDPTFFISQVHRLWVTTSLVYKKIEELNVKSFLDLGSFPFFACLIIRDYFKFTGNITVTTNLELTDEGISFLKSKNIDVHRLDLDPFVHDPSSTENKLPVSLNKENNVYDLILLSHVIEHLYHPKTIIHECARLLKPNGSIVITTDNAMMIDVFANYIGGYGYIFEPVQQTAAMQFDFWRGHVRFFTDKDIITLLENAGFSSFKTQYFHCFYDVFFEEYFKNPIPVLAGWKRKMLSETPWLRNDVFVIAQL